MSHNDTVDLSARQAIVILPIGVKHNETRACAESWAAWDSLRGPHWIEQSAMFDADGRVTRDEARAVEHVREKIGRSNGHRVVVSTPLSYKSTIRHAA